MHIWWKRAPRSCNVYSWCTFLLSAQLSPQHLLYTLSAIQLFVLFDCLDEHLPDRDAVAAQIAALQQPDGSFVGDSYGEVDTRFSYCAILALSLLDRLSAINVPKAIEFILACKNFDEAFGAVPTAESHAGQTFCCVAALAIVGALHCVDADALGWWCAERQLPCGGLNGRPEKKEDVCYSWWVLSTLALLNRLDWIDCDALAKFILSCQDGITGGISDRPDNCADVFHLFFGICGLSLLKADVGTPSLLLVDPAYALPVDVVKRVMRDRKI